MVGNENSGRKKEPKSTVSPYKPMSYSGKYFSNMLTEKPLTPAVTKNPTEELTQTINQQIQQKIESWALIKKAENTGMPKEIIDEMKNQLNLEKKTENNDQVMSQKDIMLMQMISETEDQQMKQFLLMSLMNKDSKGMDPAMMALVMNNGKKKSNNDEFMEKLAMKFLEGKTDDKNDIDKGMEFFNKMMEYQSKITPKDPLEDIEKSKERLISLGILQEPTGSSFEDKKLDLEFKKLELEHERETSKLKADSEGKAEIYDNVSKGISALLGALGHIATNKKGDTGPTQEERTTEQIKNSSNRIIALCSNPQCKQNFPVVTTPDRSINCPNKNCNFKYIIKDSQFFLSPESEELLNETSSSNEQDVKLE